MKPAYLLGRYAHHVEFPPVNSGGLIEAPREGFDSHVVYPRFRR